MDMERKKDLKEQFEKSLESLFHTVQTKDYRPVLPYGKPMHLTPVIANSDVVKKSFSDRRLQSGNLSFFQEQITNKYGAIKKDLELVKEDIKKRVQLSKIKEVYMGERQHLQTKNNIPDYQKYSKARDLRNSIGKVKQCMSGIEERLEKRIRNINGSIQSLEKLKNQYQRKLENERLRGVSKNYIEIKDGIILCDNIIKKANEKVNSYSNAAWKNILPKEKPLLENLEVKPWVSRERNL
jgi:hypothetical protein